MGNREKWTAAGAFLSALCACGGDGGAARRGAVLDTSGSTPDELAAVGCEVIEAAGGAP